MTLVERVDPPRWIVLLVLAAVVVCGVQIGAFPALLDGLIRFVDAVVSSLAGWVT